MRSFRTAVVAGVAGLVVLAAPLQNVGGPRPVHALGLRPLVTLTPEVANGALLPTPSKCFKLLGKRCYDPAMVVSAYNADVLHAQGIDGRGRTIALVVPFGSPTIADDLKAFDRKFGLPDPPAFKVIQPVGPVPAFDPTDAARQVWAGEATLDVQWSHAMAPGANIVLVETPVDETEGPQGFPEIVAAENYVIDHGLADVISQSFGATEPTFPTPADLQGLRSAFTNAAAHGVTVLAGSGDTGATGAQLNQSDLFTSPAVLWPSSDPLVTSVGGTELVLDDTGTRTVADAVWNDNTGVGGGGMSAVFRRPSYQHRLRGLTAGRRATPDVAMTSGPVWIRRSFLPRGPGFTVATGTSVSAPLFAGVVAMADQMAGRRLGGINRLLYHLPADVLVDVTAGNNSFGPFTNHDRSTHTVTGYQAGPGYDLASGLGTVDAARLVPALAGRPADVDESP